MESNNLPVWLIFLATILGVIVAIEAGFRTANSRRSRTAGKTEKPDSAITGALLGLSAFILVFTFSIVANRYDMKRTLVRNEAVALRTAWKRMDFLPESSRSQATALLQQYVDARIRFAEGTRLEPELVKNTLFEAQSLQDRLWAICVDHAKKDPSSDVAALVIESLNETNGMHVNRVAVGLQAKIPAAIWISLYSLTMLSMMSVGYQAGIAGSQRSMSWHFLALAFALVFALIGALDRPDVDIMRVTQQPLIDLREAMDARKP